MAAQDWQALTRLTAGAPFYIERVRLADEEIAIEGRFAPPPLARLAADDALAKGGSRGVAVGHESADALQLDRDRVVHQIVRDLVRRAVIVAFYGLGVRGRCERRRRQFGRATSTRPTRWRGVCVLGWCGSIPMV